VRELRFVGLVGALLVFVVRVDKGMRPADWALVLFCIAPVLLHGLLGARRGPTFMAVLVVAGGWVYFMRKRVNLPLALAGGVALGFLMLFLVANRGEIHLGTDFDTVRNPVEFLDRWNSNEYLIGSAVVRLTQDQGGFYGARQLTHLLGRLIPSAIWPTVYEDLSRVFGLRIDITINGGVDPATLFATVGWQTSRGAAQSFIGSIWLEFQYLSPIVSFVIGYLYGRIWKRARANVTARVVYLLLIALSVYLVMQGLDPWLYRSLLFGVPLLFAISVITVRHRFDRLRLNGSYSRTLFQQKS